MHRVVTAIAGFVLLSCPLAAQVASGTITVLAEDATQAVVPGAGVSVTNRNTGLTRTGDTNAGGESTATFLRKSSL